MAKLITLDSLDGEKFINKLKDRELIVYEDIQGSKIWVNYDGRNWNIRPKSVTAEPISMIDLAMQRFYNHAYLYFSSLPEEVCDLLNKRWQFCFEYFSDNQPANITYDRLPKNNLILTCIYKGGKRYTCNVDEINEFANLFDTDKLPIIFRGILSSKHLTLLNHFIHTSEKDLEYVFGETSFAEFFYKILSPQHKNSFLMNTGSFQQNLEKILIRLIDGEDEEMSMEILNPLYQKVSAEMDTEFLDVYSLILVNFMQFCQSIMLDTLKVEGKTYAEAYIDLMSRLFNLYMAKTSGDLINFQFVIPPFFNQDKFKINRKLILNRDTVNWIMKSDKLEYVFKVILSSFQKPKRKPIGIFTEQTITTFNKLVMQINNRIRDALKYAIDLDGYTKKVLNFDEFAEIAWETDADGKAYPNSDEIYNNQDDKKKKLLKKGDSQDYGKPQF